MSIYIYIFFFISIIVVLVDKFSVLNVHHALVHYQNLVLKNLCVFVKLALKNLKSTLFNL